MNSEKPSLSDWVEYIASVSVSRLITLLPHPVAMFLAGFLGAVLGRLTPFRKKVVSKNLDIAFGKQISKSEKKRLMLEATRTVLFMAVDSLFVARRSLEWSNSLVTEDEGSENIASLRKTGTGWINVTAHLGSWDVMATQAHKFGTNLHTISKPLHNQLLQESLKKNRGHHNLKCLWTDDPKLTRKMISILRDGGQINFLADQDMRLDGIFVDFFGKPASTTKGPAWFSLKYDVPILVSFLVRLGPTRHRLVTLPPIFPSDAVGDDVDEKIWWLTQEYTKRIEDMVRQYPAQYFWVHRRWKTTPEAVEKRLATLARKRQESSTGK